MGSPTARVSLTRVPVSPFEVVRTSAWRASAVSRPWRAAVRVSMQLPVTDARAAPSAAHLGWRNHDAERPGPPQPPQAQRTPARHDGNFSILRASRDLPSQCAAARPRISFWPSLAVRTGSHRAVEAPPESDSESPGTLNRQAGWFQLRRSGTHRDLFAAYWLRVNRSGAASGPLGRVTNGHCHVGGAALTAQPSQYLM